MALVWRFFFLFIYLWEKGDGNEKCESDLSMKAVDNYFEWRVEPLTKYVQGTTSWNLQLNDTEAGIAQVYAVKCQPGCQHCKVESRRPQPPQEITYNSTNGSNLCFKWKVNASTNYTMFYRSSADYLIRDFQLYNKRCTAQRLTDNEVECCPDDLPLTGNIGVRIDYENQYMYVYGIKYVLRARTIVVPNPLKLFTYQLLNATKVGFQFEDPEDWNSYSFSSILDKRICQKSPLVQGGACTELNNLNSWIKSGLSYYTEYTYTAQCSYVEGRWSEEKNITFRTGVGEPQGELNLTVVEDGRNVALTWMKPQDPRGPIDGYDVVKIINGVETTETISLSPYEIVIPSDEVEVKMKIKVSAFNIDKNDLNHHGKQESLYYHKTYGNAKEKCESDLTMKAVDNVFEWKVEPLTKYVQGTTSWNLQLNDTEARISKDYDVKCEFDCQHCNVESHRPEPPQEISYRSTNGSNLCFQWKVNASTNYTMIYRSSADYLIRDFQHYNKRCTAQRLIDNEVECCPDDLPLSGNIGVRIDYENQSMYVYGVKYVLRARTIAIPNPLKLFTYQLLNATKVEFQFEDPEDWNFYSFSSLDKQICQKSPPVQGDACTELNKLNSWMKSGLSYYTEYTYTAQCGFVEGRWSEEKNITFRTGVGEPIGELLLTGIKDGRIVTFKWVKPKYPRGPIDGYDVVKTINGNESNETILQSSYEIVVPSNDVEVEVKIQVSAFNIDKNGRKLYGEQESLTFVYRIGDADRDKCESDLSMKAVDNVFEWTVEPLTKNH